MLARFEILDHCIYPSENHTRLPFPSPTPFLILISPQFHAGKVPFLGLSFLLNPTETLATQAIVQVKPLLEHININNSLHFARKYARIFVRRHYLFREAPDPGEKRAVFRECSSRKTVSFEEKIMSKDKYPSIFLPQMGAIVFIILQMFFATRVVLKIGEY